MYLNGNHHFYSDDNNQHQDLLFDLNLQPEVEDISEVIPTDHGVINNQVEVAVPDNHPDYDDVGITEMCLSTNKTPHCQLSYMSHHPDYDDTVPVVWHEGHPKQGSDPDCGMYLRGYVYHISSGIDMKFNKDDIRKDRALLAYKILTDPSNIKKGELVS